jgi:farnesyl diphosphate synthase
MSCFAPRPAPSAQPVAFDALLTAAATDVRNTLDTLLPQPSGPAARLYAAMRYCALGHGKAFRAFLVLATADVCGADRAHALRVAAAIEALHAYSLTHDDLPAMDDSALRRGQATAHLAFDEATAILAGDALLTLAFEILADPATHPAGETRAALVRELAQASGAAGMVGGQMIDLLGEEQPLTLPEITHLHALKTGALITFSCVAGALLGNVDPSRRAALQAYGDALGLLFQITDDLLDAEGEAETLGKPAGADAAAGKATFVSLLGIQGARARATMIAATARKALGVFGAEADCLRAAIGFLLERRH